MNHTRWLKEAKKEARKSSFGPWRLGAVIVKGNRVIGKGYNKYSAQSVQIEKKYGVNNLWSLHAEMAAILDANECVAGAILFVAGVKFNGRRVFCRPCKNCMKILRLTGIAAVYYQTKDSVEAIFF